ncbi:MAG: N-acetylmuramoyl-L-alanine amidase [Clostridia bacterium]|nr:N-acetylmuramoyl-L-alanine amidase [Clostridia bacterium]
MNINTFILTKNDCYRAGRKIRPQGIVVHSTGVNQKKMSVFLNSWNKSGVDTCVHAFIGLRADGKEGVVQTLPWTMRSWGVGSGKYGSYNNSHIQFEICEDALKDKVYFDCVFDLAAQLCAFLCRSYAIPIDGIVSHAEAHKKGYASNHADCDHWLKKFGKTMNDFRAEVKRMTDIQTTVEHMIEDGVTTEENRESWEQFLSGKAPMNPDYVRAIFDRYHERKG